MTPITFDMAILYNIWITLHNNKQRTKLEDMLYEQACLMFTAFFAQVEVNLGQNMKKQGVEYHAETDQTDGGS